ncbi:MAG: hypothetical protein ACI8YP_002834 [Algoriphagus sp.]
MVEKIEVKSPKSWRRTDAEITNEILIGLKSNCTIPEDKITVKAAIRRVTLKEKLPWTYQSVASKNVLNYLRH